MNWRSFGAGATVAAVVIIVGSLWFFRPNFLFRSGG